MPKKLYKVHIQPMSKEAKRNWGDDYRFSVSISKKYGDYQGLGTCCRSKEEVLRHFQTMKKVWEGYDSILCRLGDKVTMGNLDFSSFTKEITIGDLFGQPALFTF